MIAVVCLGCTTEQSLDPFEGEPPPERVLVTESFLQEPLPAVDLLLVIDDTASMEREQDALSSHLPALVAGLDDAGVDWHLGVVSTDMARVDAGWLHGSPFVLTPATPGVEDALAVAAEVGLDGSSPEAGFAAAALALDLAGEGAPNAGFRRPEAPLHVVFVSDADDGSDAWLGDDPVAAFLAVLAAESAPGAHAVVSAIVGDVPRGCATAHGTATAAPRYHDAVGATGGAVVSVCDVDLVEVVDALGEASVTWPTAFALRGQPIEGTMRVEIDGVRLDEGWSVTSSPASLLFASPPDPGVLVEVAYFVEVAP